MRIFRSWLIVMFVATGIGTIAGCTKSKPDQTSPSPNPTVVNKDTGFTIELNVNQDPDPLKPGLKKSSAKDVDHVRWHNTTTTDRIIHFKSDWPFMEGVEDIKVPANSGYSQWYSLDHSKDAKDYPYEVQPSLFSTTPPDEPSISVGD